MITSRCNKCGWAIVSTSDFDDNDTCETCDKAAAVEAAAKADKAAHINNDQITINNGVIQLIVTSKAKVYDARIVIANKLKSSFGLEDAYCSEQIMDSLVESFAAYSKAKTASDILLKTLEQLKELK